MTRGSALGGDSIVGFLSLSLNKNDQGLRPWGDSIVGFVSLSLVSLVLPKELNKNDQGLRPWGGFYCWVSFYFSCVS
jgi:hypothetical protein